MPASFVSSGRIAVVGAGVVGLASAIALRARGFEVVLIDRDDTRDAASWGNAGHIATEQVEPLASPAMLKSAWRRLFRNGGALALPIGQSAAWLPFTLRLAMATRRHAAGATALKSLVGDALPAWRRLARAIEAPDLLREDGHFVAWESAASAARGRAAWARADTGTARFRDASADELAQLRALVSMVADAIRFAGSAQIASLPDLAAALDRHFGRIGGVRRTGCATLSPSPAGALLSIDGVPLPTDRIVIAAGVASAALLAPLGHRVPMIAERGYHIEAAAPGWPETLPPVVFEDRAMIVTRFRSGLRAASFVEFARASAPPDPAKWDRLASHAAALRLPLEGEVSRWMGARPTLPDYLPAIGRSANVFYAFGHNHLGLTLAATTAERMAELITGARPAIDLAPFALTRFGGRKSGEHDG